MRERERDRERERERQRDRERERERETERRHRFVVTFILQMHWLILVVYALTGDQTHDLGLWADTNLGQGVLGQGL